MTATGGLREARIDLAVLRSNLRILRDLVAPARVLAVVKADAYGHGAALVARALEEEGVDQLGVADLDEALALRAAGIRAPLLAWLHGPEADFAAAVAAGVEIAVSSLAQLEAAAAVGPAVLHVKLDTGLSRNGCPPEEWERVFARAAELETAGRIRLRGLMSHLSNASPADDAQQLARLDRAAALAEAAGLRPELQHIAASQAAIATPAARRGMVRLGIALYGLAPDPSIDVASLGLRPVMELAAQVVAVRRVPAGAAVSYGYTHRVERETTLALVPLGYADGVPRIVSGRGAEVAIGGRRLPVVGRVAMDQLVVDAGDADVRVGDRAVLWGDPATGAPSAEEWAALADTIGYEIVTRVGPRVPRVSA